MRNTSRAAVIYVAAAHKRATQLRRSLLWLLQAAVETDGSWHDLVYDADCIERRLRGALAAMHQVLLEDPSAYTPHPRSVDVDDGV